MRKSIIIILGLFFLFHFSLFAQQNISKKATESYQKARQAFSLSEYDKALDYCMQSIRQEEKFDKPYLLMVDIYVETGQKEQASLTLKKMVDVRVPLKSYDYLMGAKLEQEMGHYDAMKSYIDLYESATDKVDSDASDFDLLKKSCEFALHAIQHPVNFVPENLGAAINTERNEYLPCMTVDGATMIFTRRIPTTDATSRNNEHDDFFISYQNDGAWTEAVPLGAPINTEYSEGAGTISADGRTLIFTACASVGREYGAGREGFGSCDLFYSFKEGDRWNTPKNMGAVINSGQWESMPSLTADGQTLYFIRADRRKSNSGDIYVSHLQAEGHWGAPKKLPDNVNSKGKEHSAFIHPDGQTLYFSSKGHPGMGGYDMFVTRKINDTLWSDPENLGYPINTHNDETSLLVSSDGRFAYFAANRGGGFGKMDIYRFEMPHTMRPEPVSYLRGKVFDAQTLKPLLSRFEIIDLKENKTVITAYSDKITGEFLIPLPIGNDYALNVFAPDYLFYSDNFQMQKNINVTTPFIKEIPLQKIEIGESVILRNIFFDFDKADLRPESQVELMKLVDFLQKNQKAHIEIEGYTDNQGDNTYNLKLSEARAKSVQDYLIAQGIAAERLSYKGYGAAKPIQSNDTEEGRAENRRTEFRIIKM